jgi:protein involved in polysaccharide export with SLBB domain
MSNSLATAAAESPGQTQDSFSVQISQDIAQEIGRIAARRKVEVDVLVNEILEQYVAGQAKRPGRAAFLLSLAGMFSSEASDTSENVDTIVTDLILKKQKR